MIMWAVVGLIPALAAAGWVVIGYAEPDGLTRLIGLAPTILLPIAILSLAWSFRA